MDTPKRLLAPLLAPLLLVLALVLAACSSSGGSGEAAVDAAQMQDSAGDGSAADAAMAEGEALEEGAAEAAGGDESSTARAAGDVDGLVGEGVLAAGTDAPLMVRTVDVELVVDDVLAAVSRARAAAVAVDGWVSSEEVRPGTEESPGWATLVLRVPSADLDATVGSLADLGEVTSSRSSAQDVTTEYRDVEARIATLEASADRLRELVDEAASVESIAHLERELASREADLDALKARMKVLQEDVSRSTITLHLAEDAQTLAATVPETGFLAGLQQGWAAFTASVTVLLTALGGILPFAVLAAVVGVPLLLWRRRAAASTSGNPGTPHGSGGTGSSPAVPEGAAD